MQTLRHGTWLSQAHDATYGAHFKTRGLNGWAGSREIVRLANAAASKEKDVYQFGVYTAGSMKSLARRLRGFGHLYGFDSFSGLPAEAPGSRLEGAHWLPGGFSAADALGEWRLPALLRQMQTKIGYTNTTLVPGYFNESLTPGLYRSHRFQPALLVDVDVDLYSSTVQCLSWLFEHKILRPGSLVRYDDWRQIGQRHGEARAHHEVSQKYNVTWRNVGVRGINCREWQVLSVGVQHQHSVHHSHDSLDNGVHVGGGRGRR